MQKAASVITANADENAVSESCWLCSRADGDLLTFYSSDIHVHICV